MRSLSYRSLVFAAACCLSVAPIASADDTTSTTVAVTARFSSRTSLKVSNDFLRFDVTAPHQPATASVDFSAGARTQAGSEVLLSVEPIRALNGPGGASDVESSVSFAGEGDGTRGGALAAFGPTVAGRWTGSGLRHGRLVFALHAGSTGGYTVPVRFVLSAP